MGGDGGLYMEGRIKVIGVANFEIEHLEHLKSNLGYHR